MKSAAQLNSWPAPRKGFRCLKQAFERLKRMRALRRWIAADEARLRLLLGGQPAGVNGGRNRADQSTGAAALFREAG